MCNNRKSERANPEPRPEVFAADARVPLAGDPLADLADPASADLLLEQKRLSLPTTRRLSTIRRWGLTM